MRTLLVILTLLVTGSAHAMTIPWEQPPIKNKGCYGIGKVQDLSALNWLTSSDGGEKEPTKKSGNRTF